METEVKEEQKDQDQEENDESDGEEQVESGSVLFVKNLNFDSTEESLTKVRKISTVLLDVFLAGLNRVWTSL